MNQVQQISQSFRKSTKVLTALAAGFGLGLFVGTTNSLAATNLTWVAGSGDFATAANWDLAQAPAADDKTFFTNDTTYSISFAASTPGLDSNTFSNHAGVATINLGANTWTVTNTFFVGRGDATSTVYVAGGTLNIANTDVATAQLRIGDPGSSNGYYCVGSLYVTNGTVLVDAQTIVGANSNGVGKLVISGPGILQPSGNAGIQLLTVGAASSGSQLIVTNGGKLLVDGTLTVGSAASSSNNSAFFAGPTSRGTITTAGFLRSQGNGTSLIVSNGAKISGVGSILLGNAASWCTNIVVGSGSALIANGSMQIGTGAAGCTNNVLIVSDGAFISAGGTFAYGSNQQDITNGVYFGGTGLMSTGLFSVIRTASNATNHNGNFFIATNAFITTPFLNPQGPEETFAVLANATVKLTNSISLTVPAGNSNSVSFGNAAQATGGSFIKITGGTMENLVTADNVGGLSIGGTIGSNTFTVSGGGKFLNSQGTIGAGTPGNTGIVVGVGSVWSNYNPVVGSGAAFLIVGTGAGGHSNFVSVSNGGSLYNDGSLLIGNNPTATVNIVSIGGAGNPSTVINTGPLNIGSGAGTSGNRLIVITNATLTAIGGMQLGISTTNVVGYSTNNFLEIRGGLLSVNSAVLRSNNTAIFNSGTFSVGDMNWANNSNAFVVGDGTSAASYVLTNGGTGFHDFNGGGLVVTNGAALRGSGTISGNVTVLGTLAPGFSPGTITISNNLVLTSSTVLDYDLGTSSDLVEVKHNLVLDGTINVTSNAGFTAQNYTIFTSTNVTDNGLNVGTLPSGYSATVSNDTPNNRVLLVVTAAGGGDPYATFVTSYGLAGGNALGTADPDGDGLNNTNEFLAGFNPNNSAARLKITGIVRTDGTNVTINYLGASGDSTYTGAPSSRTNVLEFTLGTPAPNYATNNFASTGQTNVLSGGTGLGTAASFVDTNGASGPARYYRVRVLLP